MTGATDDQLRSAFRSVSKDAAFGDRCPPADRLWSGARGELPPAEVQAITLHLAECGACAEAWRVAREFGAPATLAAPPASAAVPWWLATAAAIILVAGGSWLVLRDASDASRAATVATTPAFAIPIEKAPIVVSSRYALTFRGANDGQQFLGALKTALDPYERGDYAAAVTTLTVVTAQYRDTMEPAFYLGVSQLLSGNVPAAITELEHARALADAQRIDEVRWLLAGAYERAGRRADAGRMAQSVCDAGGPRAPAACTAAASLRGPQ